MFYKFGNVVATGSDILTRIEMFGMRHEVFTNTGSHCKSKVGVNVDFANCRFRRFTELIFGNAYCVTEFAAIVVDDLTYCGATEDAP